jgi:hypothetical protein
MWQALVFIRPGYREPAGQVIRRERRIWHDVSSLCECECVNAAV